jgi:hypothetical protein
MYSGVPHIVLIKSAGELTVLASPKSAILNSNSSMLFSLPLFYLISVLDDYVIDLTSMFSILTSLWITLFFLR